MDVASAKRGVRGLSELSEEDESDDELRLGVRFKAGGRLLSSISVRLVWQPCEQLGSP